MPCGDQRAGWLITSVLIVVARTGWAGQASAPLGQADGLTAAAGGSVSLPFAIDGPPPPQLPQTVARDGSGRITLRAVRLASPLRLDGQLDEAVYGTVLPASDFVQTEPSEGMLATERTEVWLLFDDEHIYVSVRLWVSEPDRMVANEKRRDNPNIMQNDNFSLFLDTFYDRRNGFVFIINPIGARTDAQTTSGQYNRDWNAVWDARLGRFEDGWTAEIAIPFKSLRYRPGRAQIWGFNARRIDRSKNEVTHLAPVPNTFTLTGLYQGSFAATLVGLEAPVKSTNLEIKPYGVFDLATDRYVTPRLANELSGDVGIDVKYGVTESLTADFTYNTDFAQAEADEHQINLTRFSLFFPEKRDFFLENQGLFAFGGAGTSGRGDVPVLFYSRRIGLNRGRQVPIRVGGRLTGRVGRSSLGVVNIQTGDDALSMSRSTNVSVVRLRRDVLRKSSVGLIATGRAAATTRMNTTYGMDGTFAFYDNLDVSVYWARTRTAELVDDVSYRAQVNYAGDRYGLRMERLVVGSGFNPDVGYVRRRDMRRTAAQARFSPRPRSLQSVRRFSWAGGLTYVENGVGQLETREWEGEFATEFHSSDRLSIGVRKTYEVLPSPFAIVSGVTLPVGGYDFMRMLAGFTLAQQRRISASFSAEHGTFYNGRRTTIGVSAGRAQLALLSVEPTASVHWVDLAQGSFASAVAGSRVVYTINPRIFTIALLQYSSDTRTISANVRLRWEYLPGSELFVVYNEEREARAVGFPDLGTRALIVKVSYLLQF